ALRHATCRLAQHRQGPRCVVVISDAEPHDVDVHDPRYLIEDARRAVGAAARIGVRVVCLVPASDRGTQALQIFDHASVQAVRDFGDLPRALSRLMAW
ncbi:MAG TPA: hypothetical protein VK663_11645, partial [Burkholderiales bacterium]|nr:hypothetical protein [Burkholderiales bacterium]